VEASFRAGIQQGKKEVEEKAALREDAHRKQVLERLNALEVRLKAVVQEVHVQEEVSRRELWNIALLVGKQIAGAALQKFPLETAEETIGVAIASLRSAGTLTVAVHPDNVEALEQKLKNLCRSSGLEG